MVSVFSNDHYIFMKNAVIIQQSMDDIFCKCVYFYPCKYKFYLC